MVVARHIMAAKKSGPRPKLIADPWSTLSISVCSGSQSALSEINNAPILVPKSVSNSIKPSYFSLQISFHFLLFILDVLYKKNPPIIGGFVPEKPPPQILESANTKPQIGDLCEHLHTKYLWVSICHFYILMQSWERKSIHQKKNPLKQHWPMSENTHLLFSLQYKCQCCNDILEKVKTF